MKYARTVRIFGRPESLPADFAAQHRSVPVVNSALAAASYRTMCAQPPWCFRFRTWNDVFEAARWPARGAVDSQARDLHAMPANPSRIRSPN